MGGKKNITVHAEELLPDVLWLLSTVPGEKKIIK
jgi:hypothetical protein